MADKFKDLKYLLQLLDDEDDEVYNIVRNKIMSYGEPVLEELENAWRHTLNPVLSERLYWLIAELNVKVQKKRFLAWLSEDENNSSLIDGILLLNKMYRSELNINKLKNEIEKISQDIWLEINNNLTSLEKVKIINHFLFNEKKFAVEAEVEEHNHFFDLIMTHKKLNGVTAAVIYYSVCESLNIRVLPVVVRNRDIFLGYVDDYYFDDEDEVNNLLFLINPSSKGDVVSTGHFDTFVTGTKRDLVKFWLTTAIILLKDIKGGEVWVREYRSLLKDIIRQGV